MPDKTNDEIVVRQDIQLGSIQTADPVEFFSRAKTVADALVKLVNDKKLYSNISGRKYLQVAGWTYAGAMMGIMAREVSAVEKENGDIEATVELLRTSDGAVVGRGSAIVGFDEKTWASRPRFARRSMAITRAEGKAFRLAFPWLVALAGYEATPAEEMDGLNIVEGEVKEQPQQIKTNPVRPWTPEYLRDYIAKRVKETVSTQPTQERIGLCEAMIEFPFGNMDKPAAENVRHSITKYLIGKVSLNDATGPELSVLLNWLKPAKDSGGMWLPDNMAEHECEAVWTAAQLEAGQLELK